MKRKLPDTQTLRKWFGSSIWQSVGAIIAAVALVSTVAYNVGSRAGSRAQLTVTVEAKFPVVYSYSEFKSDVQVFYRGVETKEVTAGYVSLANSGGTPIRPTDYVRPIRLTIEGDARIADVAIIDRQPENLDLGVTQTLSRSIELSPALLNPGDSALLRLILVDDPDPWAQLAVKYDGRIVGIPNATILPEPENYPVPMTHTSYGISFWQLVTCAAISASLFLLTLHLLRRTAPRLRTGRFADLGLATLSVLTAAVAFAINRVAISLDDWSTAASWWARFWPQILLGGIVTLAYFACLLYLALRPKARPSPPSTDDGPAQPSA